MMTLPILSKFAVGSLSAGESLLRGEFAGALSKVTLAATKFGLSESYIPVDVDEYNMIGDVDLKYDWENLDGLPEADLIENRWYISTATDFVPQGIADNGDTFLQCGYDSATEEGVLFLKDKSNNSIMKQFDLGKEINHPGGLDVGEVEGQKVIILANKESLYIYDYTDSMANNKLELVKEFKVEDGLGPSCVSLENEKVLVTQYHKGSDIKIYELDIKSLMDKDTIGIDDAENVISLDIQDSRIQGLAYGEDNTIYLSRSSSKFGELLQIDRSGEILNRTEFSAGLEDIDVMENGNILSSSESGCNEYQECLLNWDDNNPFVFEISKDEFEKRALNEEL